MVGMISSSDCAMMRMVCVSSASGVRKKTSRGRLHNPFGEAMVNVVALREKVLSDRDAPVCEDSSGRSFCEHFGVVSVK